MSDILVHRTGEPELVHWGVLGMKWGVRRYQNADGSLTEEGRKRYGGDEYKSTVTVETYDSHGNRTGSKSMSYYDKKKVSKGYHGDMADNAKRTAGVAGLGGTALKGVGEASANVSKILDAKSKSKVRTTNVDARSLSDTELRQIINRLQMEQNYERLTTKEVVDEGKAKAAEVLGYVGAGAATLAALGTTASAVYMIISNVQDAKAKKN